MKKMVWTMLYILLWTMPALAEEHKESTFLSLSELSVDNLIELRDQIENELIQRGVISYFDLELNSKGDDVANLQTRLAELGYYVGNITGKFDSATRQAEKQFEKVNNLENDGVASQEDQRVLFSDLALPKTTPVPKSKIVEEKEKEIELSVNPEEYMNLDYEDIMRYPEKHKGEKVAVNGKVIQVMGNRTRGFEIRFSLSGSSDVVYVYINDVDFNILENDRMTIYATVKGTKTYSSILLQSITIPSLQAGCVILK